MQKKIYSKTESSAGITRTYLENKTDSSSSLPSSKGLGKKTIVGVALASIGGLLLLAAYLSDSVILTFIGLGFALWSVITFYAAKANYVSDETLVTMSLSSSPTLGKFVDAMGYRGRPVFLHPRSLEGMKQGYVFLPKNEGIFLPADDVVVGDGVITDKPEGLVFPAPGQKLLNLFEKKIGASFATMSLDGIRDKLPRAMIEDLRLAESLTIEEAGDIVLVTIKGKPCADICRGIKEQENSNHYGCPLCTAFALLISKVDGNPVVIDDVTVENTSIRTSFKRIRA